MKRNRQPIQEVIAEKSGISLGDVRRAARNNSQRLLFISVGFSVVMLIALWFRAPLVTYGSPFIYDEDEGHHFNRVVLMLKSGDFNPHYFLKPALHFYLRLPVTAFAFLKGVERGELRELREIRTKNPYTLSKFEYTTSHPILLKYNRAFGVCLALISIAVTFVLADYIAGKVAAVLAALLLSLAPGHIDLSAQIGVDMLMTMFVGISVVLSLRYLRTHSYLTLILAALTAGLAVASKYNAFPVCLVPIAAFIAAGARKVTADIGDETKDTVIRFFCWLAALPFLCGLGFLLGAPYSIIDFPKFLDGAAYEVWHYSDGHSSNQAGLSQLLFYTKWFIHSGVGLGILIAAGLGLFTLFLRPGLRMRVAVFALFPVLYFIYMCQQKVNFPRNMLVLLPFLCVFAAAGLTTLKTLLLQFALKRDLKEGLVTAVVFAVMLAVIAPPLAHALSMRKDWATWVDSRSQLEEWLQPILASGKRVAIPAELAVSYSLRRHPGVREINFKNLRNGNPPADEFWNQGFDYLVAGTHAPDAFPTTMTKVKSFAGSVEEQRVTSNPKLEVLMLSTAFEHDAVEKFRWKNQLADPKPFPWTHGRKTAFDLKSNLGFGPGWGEAEGAADDVALRAIDKKAGSLRWITGRYASLLLDKPKKDSIDLTLVAKSLWPGQQLSVYLNRELQGEIEFKSDSWEKKSLLLTVEKGEAVRPVLIEFIADKAATPLLSTDPRSLSVAVADLKFEVK